MSLPFSRPVAKLASNFLTNNRGNVAVMFGIALVPILTCVGAVIDYSRASSARSVLRS